MAWNSMVGEVAVVQASQSRDGGSTWSVPEQISSNAHAAQHPRVVAAGGAFRVFWTEAAKGKHEPAKWSSVVFPSR